MNKQTLSDSMNDGSVIHRESNGLQVTMIKMLPGITLNLCQMQAGPGEQSYVTNSRGYISFCCPLEGVIEVSTDDHVYASTADDLHVVQLPEQDIRYTCSEHYRCVDLAIKQSTLETLAGSRYQHLDHAIAGGCHLKTLPNSLKVFKAAETLLLRANADNTGLLTQAAAMEYLGQFLEHLLTLHLTGMNKRRQKQLSTAKARLLKDLCKAPTIPELAREVGMSQCDLKKGFKEQYGNSVFALFQQERMALGRELLHSQSVTETAKRLGYRNASHFSAAFRKQFGLLPSEARRQCF